MGIAQQNQLVPELEVVGTGSLLRRAKRPASDLGLSLSLASVASGGVDSCGL